MRLPVSDLVKVKLAKAWGMYRAGSYVEVDVVKAGTLDELGFLERPEEPTRRKGKR